MTTVALVATDTPLSIHAKTEEAYSTPTRPGEFSRCATTVRKRNSPPRSAKRGPGALGRFSIARSSMIGRGGGDTANQILVCGRRAIGNDTDDFCFQTMDDTGRLQDDGN